MTLEMKSAVLYSTSRNQIWHKGATSGDTLSDRCPRELRTELAPVPSDGRDGRGACHTIESRRLIEAVVITARLPPLKISHLSNKRCSNSDSAAANG